MRARVTASRGVVLRAKPEKDSERIGSAKKGEELEVRQLLRTASGTTRAETSRGWTTAITSTGLALLALPEEGVPAIKPVPRDPSTGTTEPGPAAKVETAASFRAEIRSRLAETPFFGHQHDAYMHGRAYDGPVDATAAPRMTWQCTKPPRDDHNAPKWLSASEFCDQPVVARRKVLQLAAMMRASTKTVVYSGAGISASVIGQAARSGQNKQGWEGKRHEAKPTFTHKALSLLVSEGLVHSWIQQNHDGLPQKAGVPQEKINEIHGSWYNPSNPVVKYSGSLDERLIPWMENDANTADLVLVLGTSLGGLYADRVATDTAERSCLPGEASALGSVMINLQQTTEDGKMSLRLFGTTDDMLAQLLGELGYGRNPRFPPCVFTRENRVLVPYDKYGRRLPADSSQRMWLDLSPGAAVCITPGHNIQGAKQPAFLHIGATKPRMLKGETRQPGPGRGSVIRRDDSASCFHLQIEGACMRLGVWWLDSAARGAVEHLPIVNVRPEMMKNGV